MAESYLGEIRMFAGNYAPVNWAFCDGQILSVSDYPALFSLLGTNYGGDGVTTFALPDLRGRIPLHQGCGPGLTNRYIGQRFGIEKTILNLDEIPPHNHPMQASINPASATEPGGKILAASEKAFYISESTNAQNLHKETIQASGGSQAHDNIQPYLCLNFIICLQYGEYPPRS